MAIVVASQALTKAVETSAPGLHRGHMLLYEHFVRQNKYSVDERFHNRLKTGMFWESLGESSSRHWHSAKNVYGVLANKKGFDYCMNGENLLKGGSIAFSYITLHLGRVSEDLLDSYYDLVSQVNFAQDKLLIPYIQTALQENFHSDSLRFWYVFKNDANGKEAREMAFDNYSPKKDGAIVKEDYFEKLTKPFVQKQLMSSPYLQNMLYGHLEEKLKSQPWYNPAEITERLANEYTFLRPLLVNS